MLGGGEEDVCVYVRVCVCVCVVGGVRWGRGCRRVGGVHKDSGGLEGTGVRMTAAWT